MRGLTRFKNIILTYNAYVLIFFTVIFLYVYHGFGMYNFVDLGVGLYIGFLVLFIVFSFLSTKYDLFTHLIPVLIIAISIFAAVYTNVPYFYYLIPILVSPWIIYEISFLVKKIKGVDKV